MEGIKGINKIQDFNKTNINVIITSNDGDTNNIIADINEDTNSIITSNDGDTNNIMMNTINLSIKEQEVLLLTKNGLTIKQIADHIFLTQAGVRYHRKNILKKSGRKNFIGI